MIKKKDILELLKILNFHESNKKNIYVKDYPDVNCSIKVDLKKEQFVYPLEKGFTIGRKTTCNFSEPENFVVFECIDRLFSKGYRPEHITIEKECSLGHSKKGGFADVVVANEYGQALLIIECKTYGQEFNKELATMKADGGQLFSYWWQERSCRWLELYSCNLVDSRVDYSIIAFNCSDDKNIIEAHKNDETIKLYKNANNVEELFEAWSETYDQLYYNDVVFGEDTSAYKIGIKPLLKKDLKDFSANDKIVNKFEEILRHNNISDKENAFNRLIALFICKLVDEIQKSDSDIVDFQYKVGTDTYESLQDRLQKLHKEGMEKFMQEKIFYVSDDYARDLIEHYTGQNREEMIKDLQKTLRILKFYSNNDFAFKDVHNEELFFQNGKIVAEVVQLFENFRIIGSKDVQMLGDLFEQLLNKGFKQNEGQFFTPVPIARFIWRSLPIENIIKKDNKYSIPKIIDYACGAGHFLTEGSERINRYFLENDLQKEISQEWQEKKIFGIEKDYRLARVSKISLYMHDAGSGTIIFGDGLDNYKDKGVLPATFDILVANPPYSVSSFKLHLKLKDNNLNILKHISNNGSEIETLFIERINQLLKPQSYAAVILPSTILNKNNDSFIAARESILKNFYLRAIVQLSDRTFGATNISTNIFFLEKFKNKPTKSKIVKDCVDAIFSNKSLSNWKDKEVFSSYLKKINVKKDFYTKFIKKKISYNKLKKALR